MPWNRTPEIALTRNELNDPHPCRDSGDIPEIRQDPLNNEANQVFFFLISN